MPLPIYSKQNAIINGVEPTKCIDLFLHYMTVVLTLRVRFDLIVENCIASFKLSPIVLPYIFAKCHYS